MIGYWIVLVIVGCALAAVIVAGTLEAEPAQRPPRYRRKSGPLVWAALGAGDTVGIGLPDPPRENWAARLAAGIGSDVTLHNVAVASSTLAEARRDQLPAALASSPDLVTVWLVLDDLLAGVPIAAYERELAALLSELETTECVVVLGNLPDLARIPALATTTGGPTLLRMTTVHWNAAIARLGVAYGARVVDLHDFGTAWHDWNDLFAADGVHLSPVGQALVADHFSPAVEQALATLTADTPLPLLHPH